MAYVFATIYVLATTMISLTVFYAWLFKSLPFFVGC